MPSSPAPSTGNYSILKGVVKFKLEGESVYRHLGNAPQIQVSITVDVLDHFSSMEGIRSKDLSVVREKSATVVLTLEEWDPENVALAVLGSVGSPDGIINFLDASEHIGALRVIGTNDVGVKTQWDWPRVSFRPSGSMDLISEEFGTMEITGEILVDAENSGLFGWVTPDITEEVEYSGSPG